jgi:hypothetical protein
MARELAQAILVGIGRVEVDHSGCARRAADSGANRATAPSETLGDHAAAVSQDALG